MKKARLIIYIVIEIIISSFILYTSTYTQQHNINEGGEVANFINRIFFASQLNDFELKTMVALGAKILGHFGLFMLDGLFGFMIWKEFKSNKATLLFLIYAFVLSNLGEFIQLFSLERSATIHDVILDFSGYVFIFICYLVNKRRTLFVFSK